MSDLLGGEFQSLPSCGLNSMPFRVVEFQWVKGAAETGTT